MTARHIPLQDIPIEVCGQLGVHDRDEATFECPMDEILESVHNGIVISDAAGLMIYANDAARRMLVLPLTGAFTLTLPTQAIDWHSEDGAALQPEDLPTMRVIATGSAHTDSVLRCVSLSQDSRWFKISAQPLILRKTNALIGVVTAYSDVTNLKAQQAVIEQVAHFDPLTNLPNRRVFLDRIEVSLARISRRTSMVAVCFLDLDGFKAVNDTFGHEGGDKLLVEVAQRIKAALRGGDSVGRIGGDEFALLLTEIGDIAECEQVLSRILQSIAQEVRLSDS
ncbi:MAG: sensor domain-containing diguanylate cyclase, partial [Pseudomonadota bacterium]